LARSPNKWVVEIKAAGTSVCLGCTQCNIPSVRRVQHVERHSTASQRPKIKEKKMKNKRRVVASRKEQDKMLRANKEGIRSVDYGVSERKKGRRERVKTRRRVGRRCRLSVPWFGPEYATPQAVLLTLGTEPSQAKRTRGSGRQGVRRRLNRTRRSQQIRLLQTQSTETKRTTGAQAGNRGRRGLLQTKL
jgi:hypothetical protein